MQHRSAAGRKRPSTKVRSGRKSAIAMGNPIHEVLTGNFNLKGPLEEEAPAWLDFVDEYVHRYKTGILEIEPSTRGAKRAIRRLLVEMLYEAIDAAVNDLDEAFRNNKHKLNATSSSSSSSSGITSSSSAIFIYRENIADIDIMTGELCNNEHQDSDEDSLRMQVLEPMVREEMEELSECMRDAIDNAF